ncbi:MAG: glucose-6-phosphate dehydrogenase [Candidatus Lloydbacteria bacterium RIFOXYC12_FULL_46_25]|uniref:Glucose-6-phosphate 1-dehydrogenase n=1 Tax=Candidatus Lloydbacteria bacterium RIFOXYC12_FULL_46_25 TaxID=1798670 RepID=A0A1G2DR05_9BACT|nr:MAG: glucose-6-phosphate dehydrogenase [Candidatus Lloydbacteria bacterium RIFOXYC12_FULL_46_25]
MMNANTINAPTIITIFGATGDLSTRKLIPALFDLYEKGFLPSVFSIVGVARRELSNDAFRDFAKEVILKRGIAHSPEIVSSFLSRLTYSQGMFDEGESYKHLSEHLIAIEESASACANKLFYLAVPPIYYEAIFEQLAHSGLTIPCSNETGWTRVLVEKPFGKDNATAQRLDETLGKLFKEEQIFRIDHYLAKEVLQDMLMFRFSNLIFEPLWNNKYIERVEILLAEKIGVESRGAFYDENGALRDVGQNHLLQMLAFVAMEDPMGVDAGRIREERAKLLSALRPITKENIKESVIRGQYVGYKETPNVPKDSMVETYFRIKAHIDSERWKGVPFYLESGKALTESKTEVKIYFKQTDSCLCPPSSEHHHQNVLTFRIQPNEGISVIFWAKKPGLGLALEAKELSFAYRNSPDQMKLPDAYERVLFDGIAGDQMLFTSTEEVAAAWKFITPILESWSVLSLLPYEQGTRGPDVSL